MRTWLWTLVVFAAAVGLALVLRDHSGNVLILVQPWRIELSLTFAIILLIAAFVALYILLRIMAWISQRPERYRSWRGLRAQKRDHNLLESGWVNLLEGRYEQADKDLTRLLGKTRSHSSKVVAGLTSARAAHHLGNRQRRDEALAIARAATRDDARLTEAVAIVEAEMYLDDNRPEEALVLLQPLQDASSRHFHATRMLLRAHQQLNNNDRVYELTRLLMRRGAIEPEKAALLIESAGAARLRKAGLEGFKSVWNDFKSDEKILPGLALAAAEIQSNAERYDEAARILETSINSDMDPRLLGAYAQCPPEQIKRRLSKAEVWLKSNPENPSLLAALGILCLTGELWGQAERYLLRSMRVRSDVRIHALLGNLYDGLGRHTDATRHWRLASDVAGKLPLLTVDRSLPAADTRHDPLLVEMSTDTDTDDTIADPASTLVPIAASAADFVSDDIDEYFDTAPIPGVDLSQTSDSPQNRKK